MKPFIEIQALGAAIETDLKRRSEENAAAYKAACDAATRPTSPGDIRVGDMVLPLEPYWYRGPGRVDEVTPDGRVLVVYGPRKGAEDISEPVCCYTQWTEVVIVERAPR